MQQKNLSFLEFTKLPGGENFAFKVKAFDSELYSRLVHSYDIIRTIIHWYYKEKAEFGLNDSSGQKHKKQPSKLGKQVQQLRDNTKKLAEAVKEESSIEKLVQLDLRRNLTIWLGNLSQETLVEFIKHQDTLDLVVKSAKSKEDIQLFHQLLYHGYEPNTQVLNNVDEFSLEALVKFRNAHQKYDGEQTKLAVLIPIVAICSIAVGVGTFFALPAILAAFQIGIALWVAAAIAGSVAVVIGGISEFGVIGCYKTLSNERLVSHVAGHQLEGLDVGYKNGFTKIVEAVAPCLKEKFYDYIVEKGNKSAADSWQLVLAKDPDIIKNAEAYKHSM